MNPFSYVYNRIRLFWRTSRGQGLSGAEKVTLAKQSPRLAKAIFSNAKYSANLSTAEIASVINHYSNRDDAANFNPKLRNELINLALKQILSKAEKIELAKLNPRIAETIFYDREQRKDLILEDIKDILRHYATHPEITTNLFSEIKERGHYTIAAENDSEFASFLLSVNALKPERIATLALIHGKSFFNLNKAKIMQTFAKDPSKYDSNDYEAIAPILFSSFELTPRQIARISLLHGKTFFTDKKQRILRALNDPLAKIEFLDAFEKACDNNILERNSSQDELLLLAAESIQNSDLDPEFKTFVQELVTPIKSFRQLEAAQAAAASSSAPATNAAALATQNKDQQVLPGSAREISTDQRNSSPTSSARESDGSSPSSVSSLSSASSLSENKLSVNAQPLPLSFTPDIIRQAENPTERRKIFNQFPTEFSSDLVTNIVETVTSAVKPASEKGLILAVLNHSKEYDKVLLQLAITRSSDIKPQDQPVVAMAVSQSILIVDAGIPVKKFSETFIREFFEYHKDNNAIIDLFYSYIISCQEILSNPELQKMGYLDETLQNMQTNIENFNRFIINHPNIGVMIFNDAKNIQVFKNKPGIIEMAIRIVTVLDLSAPKSSREFLDRHYATLLKAAMEDPKEAEAFVNNPSLRDKLEKSLGVTVDTFENAHQLGQAIMKTAKDNAEVEFTIEKIDCKQQAKAKIAKTLNCDPEKIDTSILLFPNKAWKDHVKLGLADNNLKEHTDYSFTEVYRNQRPGDYGSDSQSQRLATFTRDNQSCKAIITPIPSEDIANLHLKWNQDNVKLPILDRIVKTLFQMTSSLSRLINSFSTTERPKPTSWVLPSSVKGTLFAATTSAPPTTPAAESKDKDKTKTMGGHRRQNSG